MSKSRQPHYLLCWTRHRAHYVISFTLIVYSSTRLGYSYFYIISSDPHGNHHFTLVLSKWEHQIEIKLHILPFSAYKIIIPLIVAMAILWHCFALCVSNSQFELVLAAGWKHSLVNNEIGRSIKPSSTLCSSYNYSCMTNAWQFSMKQCDPRIRDESYIHLTKARDVIRALISSSTHMWHKASSS